MPFVNRLGDPTIPEKPVLKVLGCGGAGCNTLKGIPFITGLDTIGIKDEQRQFEYRGDGMPDGWEGKF